MQCSMANFLLTQPPCRRHAFTDHVLSRPSLLRATLERLPSSARRYTPLPQGVGRPPRHPSLQYLQWSWMSRKRLPQAFECEVPASPYLSRLTCMGTGTPLVSNVSDIVVRAATTRELLLKVKYHLMSILQLFNPRAFILLYHQG